MARCEYGDSLCMFASVGRLDRYSEIWNVLYCERLVTSSQNTQAGWRGKTHNAWDVGSLA